MKAYIFHIQILFSLFLMLIGLYEWHNWGGDYSSYIMQAMALAEGKVDEFIHYNSLTIEKTDGVLGPVAYPWGFPFLLLPIYHMAGFDLYSFKFVGVALAVLSLFIIKKYFSNKTSSKALFFLIFFIAFNPQFYGFTNFILSDIPFLCFSLLSIFLIESIFIKNYQHDSFIQILLLACVSFFAYILRGNGVAIFLTVICINAIQYIKFLKWDKHNSIYKFITYYILIAVLVCTYKLFFPDGTGYKDLSYMTVGSIMSNIKYYAFVLKEFIPFIHGKLATVVYCCTIPFFLSGLFRRWKDCLPYLIFSLITVAIFIAWPPRQGYRFLLPVIPLYLFFVFDDIIYRIGKIVFTGIQRKIISVCLIFVLGIVVARNISHVLYLHTANPQGPFSEHAIQTWDYIKNHLDKASLIISEKPRVVRMLTSVNGFRRGDIERVLGSEADFLLYYKLRDTPVPMSDIREAEPGKCVPVYENEEFILYRIATDRQGSMAD